MGFSGLYVIGPRQAWPVIFGVAKEPADAWRALKRGYWELHQVHAVCWTPGKPAAERLKRVLAERLADRAQFENHEWYNMTVAEVLDAIEAVAREERIDLFDEVERQRRIEARADLLVRGRLASFEGGRRLPPPKLIKG